MIMKGQQNYSQIQRFIFIIIIAVVLLALAVAASGQAETIGKQIATNLGLIAPALS
jgi:hypothetical protein